jgi:hypothetical protein
MTTGKETKDYKYESIGSPRSTHFWEEHRPREHGERKDDRFTK